MHSTTTALLTCADDWYSGLGLGRCVGVVYVDLKKAFDTVDHEILLHELGHYDIRGQELMWLKSYLPDRRQLTRLNGIVNNVITTENYYFRGFRERYWSSEVY